MRKIRVIAGSILAAALLVLVVAACLPAPEAMGTTFGGGGLHDMVLAVTTDVDGDATTNGDGISGWLYALEWIDGDMADGVDITVTMQSGPSGVAQTLFTGTNVNDDAWYFPRKQVHDDTGSGLTYDGTYKVMVSPIVAGVPRIVVGEGGATKTGSLILYYYK